MLKLKCLINQEDQHQGPKEGKWSIPCLLCHLPITALEDLGGEVSEEEMGVVDKVVTEGRPIRCFHRISSGAFCSCPGKWWAAKSF